MTIDSNWSGKHRIVIDNTKVSGTSDLTDFPVLLDENNFLSDVFNNTQSNGEDLRFSTDSVGDNEIPLEVVKWNQGTPAAEVWVKVPTLYATSDTTIYVHYNNSSATAYAETDTYGAQNVWNSNYKMVQHLTNNAKDSTSATLNGTLNDLQGNSSLDVYFEYGISTSYGNTTSTQTISSVPTSFSDTISGLAALTEYHYRSVATDGSNYWYGNDVSFVASDARDVDETQSEFQEGTLTDVGASSEDFLRLFLGAFESFESGYGNWSEKYTAGGSYTRTTEQAKDGSYSVRLDKNSTEDNIALENTTDLNGYYEIWVYLSGFNTNWILLDIRNVNGDQVWVGIHKNQTDNTNIIYYDSRYHSSRQDSGITQEAGWHKITIDNRNGLELFYDDTSIYSDSSSLPDVTTTGFGSYWNDSGGESVYWDYFNTGYAASGNRVSPQLDLSSLSSYSDSLIEWTATLNSQTLTIETRYSLDGGSTWSSWQTCTSGSALPGLSFGDDLSNALLECKQTLSTSDSSFTPELSRLAIYLAENKSFTIALPVIRIENKVSITGIGGFFSADYVLTLPKIRTESKVSVQDLHMSYPHIVCNVQPERIASVMGIPARSLDAVLNVN